MRSLAADLDVTPMALYRHVPNRDGLLDAIIDDALDALDDPDLLDPGPGAEALLRRCESRLDAAFGDMPDLALLLVQRGPRTDRSVAFIGAVVRALIDCGLSEEVAARTYSTMSTLALVRIAISGTGSAVPAPDPSSGPTGRAVELLGHPDRSTVDAVLEAAAAMRTGADASAEARVRQQRSDAAGGDRRVDRRCW